LVHRGHGRGLVETASQSESNGPADHEGRMEMSVGGMKSSVQPTAEQVMWNYFQAERALGRTPTGAELDRVAGTNNYGRSVIRQWREAGRIGTTL
jgi:hypothetical protein